ncbi:hypothetical protein D3C80_2105510 [compost metagenome]
MILLRYEDSQALLAAGAERMPLHIETIRYSCEILHQYRKLLIQIIQIEFKADKKHTALRVHRILIGLHDISSMLI